MDMIMNLKLEEHDKCVEAHKCPTEKPFLSNITCTDGKADEYECSNIDLLSFVPLEDLGSEGDGNDIWGWTDPETDREYAIVGCEDGTSFVDVTEPCDPKVLGFLPTYTNSSLWRDIKVYTVKYLRLSIFQHHSVADIKLMFQWRYINLYFHRTLECKHW